MTTLQPIPTPTERAREFTKEAQRLDREARAARKRARDEARRAKRLAKQADGCRTVARALRGHDKPRPGSGFKIT